MLTIELMKRLWWVPLLVVYTAAVVYFTLRVTSPSVPASSDELVERLQDAHDEELAEIKELHEKELADRDRILDEYKQEIEEARSDYWNSIAQIETQIRAQRSDIIRRINEDPDAAAKILEDKYGLIYIP
jgi:23S rRNA pseudoU1915 N3-methylase RlmH